MFCEAVMRDLLRLNSSISGRVIFSLNANGFDSYPSLILLGIS